MILTRQKVLSLDVFDTVLTRACGEPQALYLWLGRRLVRRELIECTPEVFARARALAEQQVWDRAGGMDSGVTLIDFYRELARSLSLSGDSIETLAAEELQLEEEVLRIVPQAMRLVDRTTPNDRRVVFTTDTYFSGSFVEKQLRKHNLWSEGSLCFASSDHSLSKASGGLYDIVRERLQVPPEAIAHGGDNLHSDVRTPRRKGIKGAWLPAGRINRYERLLSESMWATSGMGAALAGASRMARLHTKVADSRQRAICDVSAGVAAPILVGYVLWLLRRAQELGLQRLYFLSRDGQVFYEVAGILAGRLNLPIRLSYLWASRLSTNLAATFEADEEDLGWVFRDLPFLSPDKFLARFDMTWDDCGAEMAGIGISRGDVAIKPEKRNALSQLLQSGSMRERILERAAARRRIVGGYLRQEGLLDATRCGLVDFGGVGSQMRALHAIATGLGGKPPRLFLIGLDRPEDAGLARPAETPEWVNDTECYLYDHRRETGIKRPRGFGTCVQMFCAADHGKVTGYQRREGSIFPTCTCEVDRAMIEWGLPVLREAVRRFAEHLVLDPDLVDIRADLRAPACRVIDAFWSDSTVEEASAWGVFPFEGAQASGERAEPLAWPYSWLSVAKSMLNRSFPDLGWQHWFEGSCRLSPPVLRGSLRAAEKLYKTVDSSHNPLAVKARQAIRWLTGRSSS